MEGGGGRKVWISNGSSQGRQREERFGGSEAAEGGGSPREVGGRLFVDVWCHGSARKIANRSTWSHSHTRAAFVPWPRS
jgi:hypothetical protein